MELLPVILCGCDGNRRETHKRLEKIISRKEVERENDKEIENKLLGLEKSDFFVKSMNF